MNCSVLLSLWIPNESGVILHLKATREGVIQSLDGDAVAIAMKHWTGHARGI